MNFKVNLKYNCLFFIIFILVFSKIMLYGIYKFGVLSIALGGGSDADYYHAYATYQVSDFALATSIWPIILRWLYENDFYDRDYISVILLFINLFFIPFFFLKIIEVKRNKMVNKVYWMAVLLCLIYPTLYYYTLDIYRDVFMVFVFLIGVYFVKILLNSRFLCMFPSFLIVIMLGGLLFSLRGYLGFSFFVALSVCLVKLNKRKLLVLLFLYLLLLWSFAAFGFLDSLIQYRSSFDENENESGSTLGLDFSNMIMFIPNLVMSTLGQLFGLYITNMFAFGLFFIETIPFLLMLKYVISNLKYADAFIRFLLTFFLVYGSIWLIANDNLGTALRLRMFNYFAVYICFFYIYSLKNKIASS